MCKKNHARKMRSTRTYRIVSNAVVASGSCLGCAFRGNEFLIVEGDDRGGRHRYVAPSPGRYSNVNVTGNVTKIEVVLEEAPDDTVLAGAIPSESDATIEFNTTYSDGIIPGTGTVVVRAEEALIVALVLVLWIAAIALFFNRWGKIRMLEPYQPKFQQQQQQQHRQSCTMIDANALTHRTYSKFNIHWQDHSGGQIGGWSSCVGDDGFPSKPRRNSVFVGSSAFLLPAAGEDEETPRRTKSAFDLQSLVLAECSVQNDRNVSEEDQSGEGENRAKKSLKARLSPDDDGTGVPTVGGQRRMSVCRFNNFDEPSQRKRERGMGSVSRVDHEDSQILPTVKPPSLRDRDTSINYFDRTDVVLTKPFRGDRDSSASHFDRMDVLARPPTVRDRGRSVCQFDRMDVLARPNISYLGKSFFLRERERRLSVCNFIEKNQDDVEPREHRVLTGSHVFQRYDRRLSVSNVEKIATIGRSIYSASLPPVSGENARDDGGISCSILEQRDDVEQDSDKKENSNAYYFDRPSCSKTFDVASGYKATRV